MVRGKGKNISNRNQIYLALSECSSPTTASSRYYNTSDKRGSDLKSHLMMMIENFKKDINNSFKEIQENTGKQIEALKRKHKNPLKNFMKTQPNR
jgi:GTPase SAR1 family protein